MLLFSKVFFCSPDESMPYYHDTERSSHIKSRNLDPMFPWFFSHTSAMAPNALAEKKNWIADFFVDKRAPNIWIFVMDLSSTASELVIMILLTRDETI